MTQLNAMLTQLEASSKTTQADLPKLRIERWKMNGESKKTILGNVDSIQRNLQGALPEILGQLRAQPEDLPTTFKLYRNLDALYDVLGNLVEVTGAFGSKDDFQSLSNDLTTFEATRKQLAQRIENLSLAKEAEIARLRADLKTAQAAMPAAPPKKVIVDDNEPAKKPAMKKKPTTKPKPTTPATDKPAAGKTQTPPAQQPPSTKPQ
jgi:multidrug efflux pump subunit AcrA (membrane-fusion protein)